jgi:alkylresorcinol/alkylpyrone synthase
MATILNVERFHPPYRYDQSEVTRWVRAWLEEHADGAARLLSVYETAGVHSRASVVPIEQVFFPGDFETQNDLYCDAARRAAVPLAERTLEGAGLRPRDVDCIVSVSCTGFMIPALDAYVADALGLGPRLVRLPMTESGCAGGVVALARAADYLAAHPEGAVLVLAMELSSLTFQRWDRSNTNVVSTALFGDGGAGVAIVGARHPLAGARGRALIVDCESRFFSGTTHLMGFRLRNQGLQIVLDRGLAPFVRRELVPALDAFLAPRGLTRADVGRWILHPGGRRIVEVMTEQLQLQPADLAPTEKVLAEHGNMSSVTVLFVLDELLRCVRPAPGERGVMGAFGPGFCAELALLEFL